jgi:hypothetical protein
MPLSLFDKNIPYKPTASAGAENPGTGVIWRANSDGGHRFPKKSHAIRRFRNRRRVLENGTNDVMNFANALLIEGAMF